MQEALHYESIAAAWGFPPDVVDRQPYELISRMLEVSHIRAEVEEQKAKNGG